MPCEEKVPSATEDLKEKMLTSVESFPTTILAFWSPINAIKSPIPTDTACFRFIGMELKIASRTLVRESRIKMIPSANTAAQCLLPGISHTKDYSVGKVCVQTHSRSKNEWIVGQKRHQTACDKCGQCGCCKDRSAVHAGCRQDIRVDSQNIGHCHKGCDSCHDLSFDVCVVFFEVEKFVEIHISTPFVWCTACALKDFVSGNIFSGDASDHPKDRSVSQVVSRAVSG